MVWECREDSQLFEGAFCKSWWQRTLLDWRCQDSSSMQAEEWEFNLEPCRKYHVIAVDSDHTFSKSLFFRDVRIESLFHSGDADEQWVDEFNVDDEYHY